MSFEYPYIDENEKIYSSDQFKEGYDHLIEELVREFIFQFYDIDYIYQLTQSQMEEIKTYCEKNKKKYPKMMIGFNSVIIEWENN